MGRDAGQAVANTQDHAAGQRGADLQREGASRHFDAAARRQQGAQQRGPLSWVDAIEAHRALVMLLQHGMVSSRVPAQYQAALIELARTMGISPANGNRRAAHGEQGDFDRTLASWSAVYDLLGDDTARREMMAAAGQVRASVFATTAVDRARLRVDRALVVPGHGVVEVPEDEGDEAQWEEVLRAVAAAEPSLLGVAHKANIMLTRLDVATPLSSGGPKSLVPPRTAAVAGLSPQVAAGFARGLSTKLFTMIAGISDMRAQIAALEKSSGVGTLRARAAIARNAVVLLRGTIDTTVNLAKQVALLKGQSTLADSLGGLGTSVGMRSLSGLAATFSIIENTFVLLDDAAPIETRIHGALGIAAGLGALESAMAADAVGAGGATAGLAATFLLKQLSFLAGQFGQVKAAFAQAGLTRQLGALMDEAGAIQKTLLELEVAGALVGKSKGASERADMEAFERDAAVRLRGRLNALVELALSTEVRGTSPGKNRFLRDRLLALSTIRGSGSFEIDRVIRDARFCVALLSKVTAQGGHILQEMVQDG